jgi:hypothetical protein
VHSQNFIFCTSCGPRANGCYMFKRISRSNQKEWLWQTL